MMLHIGKSTFPGEKVLSLSFNNRMQITISWSRGSRPRAVPARRYLCPNSAICTLQFHIVENKKRRCAFTKRSHEYGAFFPDGLEPRAARGRLLSFLCRLGLPAFRVDRCCRS